MLSVKDAKKWEEALRSKYYKQGKSLLFNDINETYCCLGVLCDVLRFKSDNRKEIIVDGTFTLLNYPHQRTAIYMNDTLEKSFDQIADWVHKTFIEGVEEHV